MKLDDLILNQISRQQIHNYLKNPTQALLLTGENGLGLGTIAQALAQEIAGANIVKIVPRLHKTQTTANINIDDVRELNELTRARRVDNLVIVIDEAEKMTRDTPQALLKLLEEPSTHVYYILTSHSPERLPATILSRAQEIKVLPPSDEDCEKLFSVESKITVAKKTQIKFLAASRPAEIYRLNGDEQYFRAVASSVETAKNFLQSKEFGRLKIVAETNSRDGAITLVKNVAKLLTLTAAKTETKNANRTAANLQLVSTTLDNLAQNGNARAQLMNLAINLET